MTASAPLSRPFAFDTEFVDGEVRAGSTWAPTRRAYLPAEVEAMVAQARVEARQQALSEASGLQAMALSAIGQAVSSGMPGLAEAVLNHRRQSADLALAAARVIASAALDRFPTGPLQSALEALAGELDASPRLLVRASGLDEAGREMVSGACAAAGFTGAVSFHDMAGPVAAFTLEWSDGRAEYDPVATAARLAEALQSALAAEQGHAEPLPDGSRN
ncbi:flagellar assembly protein FlbE [Rhizobium sp. CRIBSB]|nr:flagellar assembly protein FlbE [Rhizobium sp. CRIBSB]